ncbi:homoserine O-acetyltransferase [Catalinimonas alkaloidigena]|uniref:Homoserine O-acetyltransferase n=1 Tax=Catalinimonas alkaloidigena TaxID=1075417 RepID=A0A1G9DQP3_9BACT|nr:homoserine O-acetyltransferase [Catalinimonas alkaloidigena]SDK66207.1 homoserine O-acetyltransferase [Catalinimonas alkaloidigena]
MDAHIYEHSQELPLELGGTLPGFQLAYCTVGTLNATRSNVIWICHALTANADPAEWWPGMIGEGKLFDPTTHFIVCANILGSCYGSTGPLSVDPRTGQPFYHTFPRITVRDIVQAHIRLRDHLGIDTIELCIGGSLGGQQAVEWAIMEPERIKTLILLATNAFHSPWGVAFNESQRMAIETDPTWQDSTPEAGLNGMKTARSIALLSYRNYTTYWNGQMESNCDTFEKFRASSYQRYQGEKLAKRFNAYSYYALSLTMDSHHVGRGRGSAEKALSQIQANTLSIGISSDVLFPTNEQLFLFENIPTGTFLEIDSDYGHDGFLIETEQLTRCIQSWQKMHE